MLLWADPLEGCCHQPGGSFGALGAPKLVSFFGRDTDNLNSSYDAGDQLVLHFDMAINQATCMSWTTSVDNLPVCARRASGGRDYVDSLFQLTASLGTNYSGAWEDQSTFVITVVDSPPALAPRPYDTVLRIPPEANLRNMAGASEQLTFGPVTMGVASRVEVFPSPPVLTSFSVVDPINRDLTTGPGDVLKIAFDRPADRAGRALGGNGLLGLLSEVLVAQPLFHYLFVRVLGIAASASKPSVNATMRGGQSFGLLPASSGAADYTKKQFLNFQVGGSGFCESTSGSRIKCLLRVK